jgi:hypothetical protein
VATLVFTLLPNILGGVMTKAKILSNYLRRAGQDVTIAFYAARGTCLELNVGLSHAFSNHRSKSLKLKEFGNHNCVVVGCQFPEIERRYTVSSALWVELIQSHEYYIAVGGSVLIVNPLEAAGVKYLFWCACDVEGDRWARPDAMGVVRYQLDRFSNTKVRIPRTIHSYIAFK